MIDVDTLIGAAKSSLDQVSIELAVAATDVQDRSPPIASEIDELKQLAKAIKLLLRIVPQHTRMRGRRRLPRLKNRDHALNDGIGTHGDSF